MNYIEAKSTYEVWLVQDFASGSNYKITNVIHICPSNNRIATSIYHDAISAFTNIDKANLLNNLCNSTFTASNFSPPAMGDILVPDSTSSSVSLSDVDGYDILVSLDVSKTLGIDGMGPSALALCNPP